MVVGMHKIVNKQMKTTIITLTTDIRVHLKQMHKTM